jgi:hypothetical protein
MVSNRRMFVLNFCKVDEPTQILIDTEEAAEDEARINRCEEIYEILHTRRVR